MNKKHLAFSAVLATLLGAGMNGSVAAAPIVLDFEGVGNSAAVNNFYNGGTDSQGNSGPNFGIGFSPTSLGVIGSDAGGTGNIRNEPSKNTALFFLSGGAATMNVGQGFDTGFSFFYASSDNGFVRVFDGLDGTGSLLAQLNLGSNISGCPINAAGTSTLYCNWTPIGVNFGGIARSVDFGGTVNQIAFDDVTFGSATAGDNGTGTGSTGNTGSGNNAGGTTNATVPEPGTIALIGLGLLGATVARRKKTLRKNASSA